MSTLPDLGAELVPLVGRLPEPARPRFLALLERAAARRYESWAATATDPEAARGFRACAAREDEIAGRIEETFPPHPDERALVAALLPEVQALAARAFDGRPLPEQLAIQAAAERRGAAAWRGMAAGVTDAASRATLVACARLEEESAAFLEDLLRPT